VAGASCAPGSPLFEHIASLLRAGWSPLQIAGRLRRMEPEQRPGPDHLGPDHLGPDHLGPDHLGPDHLGPDRLGPDHLGPDHLGPDHLGPDHLGPDHLGPDHLGPDRLGPDHLGPDHLGPDHLGTVCHETIYTALYALPRGELRRELLTALRQGRQNRRPRSRGSDRRQGFVTEDVRIAERPEDVIGRIIPGHWEGDLIKGAANRSAVGTLVERTSRLVILTRMPALDAETTAHAFEAAFDNVPEPFKKSLTYDRGTEMARHAQLTQNTGIKVWFCDPYSPWQRPSNENANGLIRQYLPKGTDLSHYSQDQLNEIAERLNNRPRKILNFETPNEVFARLVAEAKNTHGDCCTSG
jgi:IS30 family transposase